MPRVLPSRHLFALSWLAGALSALAGCAASAPPVVPLAFAAEAAAPPVALLFSPPETAYLTRLRETYALDAVVADAETDLDRVLAVSAWARSQWEHNGSNTPSASDPLTILEEAAEGQRFRCVEYAEVVAGALSAVGVPARVLGIMMSDVETRSWGAGHVVAEAYLADRDRWVLVDGQFDVVPFLDGDPLSALELQRALVERPEAVRFESVSGEAADPAAYRRFVGPYLYYFKVSLDQRYDAPPEVGALVLGPLGAPEPTRFQGRPTGQPNQTYTHHPDLFYAAPTLP